MSDLFKGVIVTFENDMCEDDPRAQAILTAIRLMRGVAATRLEIANPGDSMNRDRIRHEIANKMWKILEP